MARIRERVTKARFKTETTPGVDSSPTGADFLRIIAGSTFAFNPDIEENDEFRGGLGAGEHTVGPLSPSLTLINNVRGSGVANTPPEGAACMLACGMLETINAAIAAATAASGSATSLTAPVGSWPATTLLGQALIGTPVILGGTLPAPWTGLTPVDFVTDYSVTGGNMTITLAHDYGSGTPLASGAQVSRPAGVTYKSGSPTPHPSGSAYLDLDGILQKFLGARGSMSMNLQAGKKATQQFDFQGLDGGRTDSAILTGETDDPTSPPRWKDAICAVNRKTVCASSLTWSLNQTGAFPDCPAMPEGRDAYEVTGRRAVMTINPDMNLIASQGNYLAALKAGTIMPIAALLGSRTIASVGNRVGVCMAEAKLRNVTPGVRNGFRDETLEAGSRAVDGEIAVTYF